MSNLAAPDEKHTKQLGADSVAGCENYDPAIIKDKEGDDINGTEAVVREVINRVCQMVSEVCLTVESDNHIIGAPSPTLNVPQSSCSASIKRCSVEAADESSNSRDSSDSETSQFNEPVALNIVQEKLSPKADDDSVSSTVDADALSPDDDAGEALQPDDAEQVSQDHQRLETNDQSQSHRFLKDMQDLPDSPKNLERIADQQTQATQESNFSTESLIELIKDMHPPAPLENPDFVESVSIEHNAPTPITGSIEEKVDQSVAVEQLRIDKSNDQVEPVLEVKQTFASDKRDSTKPHTSRNMDSSPAQNLIVSGNSEEIQRSEIASENRLAIKEQHISPVAVAVEVQNYRIDASQESVCKEDQDGSSQHLTSTQKTKLSPTFSGQSRYSDLNLELQANRSGDTDNESNKFHFEQLPTAVSIVEDYCSSDSNSPDLTIEQHDVTDFVKKQSEHEPQHCEEDSSQISGELQTEQQHNQKAAAAAQSSENDHHQIEIDFQKSPETSESDADIQEATLTLDDLPDNETNKAEPTDLSDIDTVNNIQLPSESANKSHFKTDANLGDEGLIETRDSQTIVAEAPEKSLSFPVASIVKYEAVSSGAYSLVQNRTESDNTFSAVSQLLSDLCLKVASSMEATASDSEEENEDLMSELQGAKHVSGAAAEGEADDDYMSELCGDGQLAKAVQSPMDTETDLMKELSGGGNQLTNVITLSEDSGDEDDTESKLVLCTSTTLGQSGSADIEAEVTSLVEAGAEVVSGSVSLPSTSTPALLQIKSAAPVAASIASTTADALANIKAMAALASGSSSDELAALKRRLEQLEAENKMLKQSIQPASTDSVTTAPAAPTLTSNAVVSTSATSGTAGSGMQHPQADSSGSPQSFSSYDSSSQNYIPAGGFLKSLSEIEEAGGACADATVSTPSTTPQQQQQTTLDSGIASVVTAAAAVPASTIATAAIQGPVCSISGGASTAAGSIPATITPSGQIQFILPPGVLPSSFAGLTAVPTVQPSLSSTVPLSVTAATAVATTTATTSTAKLTTPLKSAPTPSKLSQSASASSSASTPSNRRIRTIAPKPIAMRPILPSPKTDMSTKLPPIQLSSKNASATSASTTSGKKSKTSTAASKKPTQPVTASSTAMHAAMPAGMPMAMQLPSGALAAVSQSKSLPVVVGTPIGMCASMGSLLAGAGISMPVNHSSGTAVWAAAPPGATFATTWAQTAPTAVVFSTGQPLSAGSLEGTALPSHDLLAIACQEAGLSLDLDLGSTVMISTSQDSGTPMIEGVGCEQQSATVTDLGGLVDAQQGSSFLHELGLIQPPQEDGVIEQQTPAEVSHSAESVIHCPPLQQQQLSQDPTGQQQQQQQQQCWNTTTFDDFNAALNDFNSDAVTTTSAPTQPSPASKTTHGASRTPTKSATTKNSDASTCGAASAASASSQLSVSTESNATPLKMTAPAVSPAKKSHHKAKTTPPIPSASGSSSTNQPAVSVSATSVEVPNVSSGKQQSAQAHKSKSKKKSSALQQTSIPEKRGGTSKKTTPAKDREAKATSSAAKQQSEIGDDTELFKEIIPLKSAVHKLSENDEIEEAVKGIVGFSSLEDTISGVLKAGEAADAATPAKAVDVGELSRLTSPTKCSSDQRPAVTTPTSQAPPPPSSSSISQPTLQQLAELAAAGDSCPVVSIPESAGLPFGDISCLATAEVSDPVSQLASTDTFIKKSSAIPPCVSESKEEDWLSSKKKLLQGKKTTTSAARQDPSAATSTSSGSQNKRRSTDATPPGPSSKDKLAPDDKPHKSTKGTSSESRTKELVKRKEKSSLHEPAKKSNPLPSLGTETNDSKSKEAATAKLDKPKASSRSALYRSKLSTSEKSAAPETLSSTRSESSERKQKQDKESSSKNNASEFGPEPAVKELVKVSGKSKSIEDLKPIATSSKSKSSSKKMKKKKGSKLSPSKPVKVFDEPTKESTHFSSLRRSERSRSVNKLKRDDSRESRRPQSSVSTSEVASVGGGSNSSKSIRTSRRIAEKSVEKRRHSGSRSRSAQAGRLSDVDTDSSEDDSNESEAADTEKQVVVKSNVLKKTATSTASLSSGSNSPTKISGGSKLANSGVSRQDSDQLLYEHHPMHGEPVTSREKRLSARRARLCELELHEAVEASKVTANAALVGSSAGKNIKTSPDKATTDNAKRDAKGDKDTKESPDTASSRTKDAKQQQQQPPPLPELKPGDEIAAALEDVSGVGEGIGLLEASGSGLRGIGDAANFLWNRAVLGGSGSGSGGESLAEQSHHRRQAPLIEERSPSPPPQPSLALEIIAKGGINRSKPPPSPQLQLQQPPQQFEQQLHLQPQLPSPLLLSSPLASRIQSSPQLPPPQPPPPPPPPPAPPKPAFVPMNLSKLERREASKSKESSGPVATPTTPTPTTSSSCVSSGSPIKRKFFSSDREDRRRFLFKQNFGSVGAKTGSGAAGSGSAAGGSTRGQFDFEPDAGGKRARRNQSEAAAAAALLDLSTQKIVPPLSISVATAEVPAAPEVPKVPKISIKPLKPDAAAMELQQPQEDLTTPPTSALSGSSDPQIPIKLKLKLSNQLQQQQLQQQMQQQQQQQQSCLEAEGKLTVQTPRVEVSQQPQQFRQQKLLECGSPRPMGYDDDYAQILKQKNKKREKRQHHRDKQQRKKDRKDKKRKAKTDQHLRQQQPVSSSPGAACQQQQQVSDSSEPLIGPFKSAEAQSVKQPVEFPSRVHPFLAQSSADLDQSPEDSPHPVAAEDSVGENSADMMHRLMAKAGGSMPISSQEVDAVLERAAEAKAAATAAAAATSSSSMILPKKRKIYQPGSVGGAGSADDFTAAASFDQQQQHQQLSSSASVASSGTKRRHLDNAGSLNELALPQAPVPLTLPPPPAPMPLTTLPLPPAPQSLTHQQHHKKKDDFHHIQSSVYQHHLSQQQPQQQLQPAHHHHQHHPATPGSVGAGGLSSPWGGSSGYGGHSDPSPYGGVAVSVGDSSATSAVAAPAAAAAPIPPPPPAVPAPPTFNPYEAAAAAAANTYGNQFLSQYDPYGLNFVYQRAQQYSQYSSDYFGWQANHHAAVAAYGHHFPPVFPPAAAAAAAATGEAYHTAQQHHQHHHSTAAVSSASLAGASTASAASDLTVGNKRSAHYQQHQQHQHHHQQPAHQHQQQQQQHQHHQPAGPTEHSQHHHHHHAAAAAAAAAATNAYRPADFYSQTSQLLSNFYPPAFDPRRAAASHHLNPFGGNPFP